MGRLEKIVVLTVLFLVTVILGVSLNQQEGVSAGPVSAAGLGSAPSGETLGTRDGPELARREPSQPRPLGGADEAARRRAVDATRLDPPVSPPTGALTAEVETPGAAQVDDARQAEPPSPAPSPAPVEERPRRLHGTLVVDARDLLDSPSPDYFFYEWRSGDTWTAVAERVYGDRRHVGLLRAANEGKSSGDLAAGTRVWVPAREQEDPSREGEVIATASGRLYEVASGDSLSVISDKVYGTSKRWREIFEANRDVLADPDRLEVGTKLRIPE